MIKVMNHQGYKTAAAGMILAAVFIFLTVFQMNASKPQRPGLSKPDFAYPQKVIDNARDVLSSLAEPQEKKMAAAIQLVIASNSISADNAAGCAALLDSLSTVSPKPYSALYAILEARLYADIYSSDSWTFDSRAIPAGEQGDDPSAWSRANFIDRCRSLAERARNAAGDAAEKPLGDIAALLDKCDAISYLTIADFIDYQTIDVMQTFYPGRGGDIIPFGGNAAGSASPVGGIYSRLIDRAVNAGNVQAMVLAVSRNAYATVSGSRRPAYLYGWITRYRGSEYIAPLISSLYDCRYAGIDDLDGSRTAHDADSLPSIQDYYRLMTSFLDTHPSAPYRDMVRQCVWNAGRHDVRATMKSAFVCGSPVEGDLHVMNADDVWVSAYRIPEGVSLYHATPAQLRTIAASRVSVGVGVERPGYFPFATSTRFTLQGLKPGHYVLKATAGKPSAAQERNGDHYYSGVTFEVSDIMIMTSIDRGNPSDGRIYVVGSSNQKPIPGADVDFYRWVRGKNSKVLSAVTNEEGYVEMPDISDSFDIVATYGGSRAEMGLYGGRVGSDDSSPRLQASVITDLSVYKPGEKTNFAVVAYKRSRLSADIAPGVSIDVLLNNASGQRVDSLRLVTDRMGRADGGFEIPAGAMLGSYSIEVQSSDERHSYLGQGSFEVADYKTPGFYVELKADSAEVKPGMPLRFKGMARTYSGMPVADADVSYNIGVYSPWWWRGEIPDATYSGTARTDAAGVFEIVLCTEVLKDTPFARCSYSMTAAVTSTNGETYQSQPCLFAVGSGYSILFSGADRVNADADTISFDAKVYDLAGTPVVVKAGYTVRNVETGTTVCTGRFDTPALRVPSACLPSGEYDISVYLESDTTVQAGRRVVVCRDSDPKPPVKTPLWISGLGRMTQSSGPGTQSGCYIAADSQERVSVKVGSAYADSHIWCQVSDGKGFVSRRWTVVNAENAAVDIPFPPDADRIWVSFSGVRDFDVRTSELEFVRERACRSLSVKAESIRDRLTPGEKTRWRFIFDFGGLPAADVAAMAVMTDKAINSVAPFSWSFNPRAGIAARTLCSLGINKAGTSSDVFRLSADFRGKYESLCLPQWNFYGEMLYGGFRRGYRYLRMAAPMAAYNSAAETEGLAYDAADSAAGNAEMVEEEAMAEPMEMKTKLTSRSVDGGSVSDEVLRPMEMPRAFFMPALVSDAGGVVEVPFEVPDFNTTWQFQLLGYDSQLYATTLTLDAVASRPVMVQTNMPQFLRVGDKASLQATLYNNSSEFRQVGGRIVVYDLAAGGIVTEQEYEPAEVAPSGSRTVTLLFDVPSGVDALGVRAYAMSESYSDAEQGSIDVLPSSTPVTEAYTFYLRPGSDRQTLKLPDFKGDASVTLRYSGNAVMDCLLALPAISEPSSASILSFTEALFANSVASGMAVRYPALRSMLGKMKSGELNNPGSPLQNDSQLKIVALDNTPWVNDAASETARMGRLTTLLDSAASRLAIYRIAETILERQNTDGGWGWCPDMPSSVWITSGLLLRYGMLEYMGLAPADTRLADAMKRGVAWCDSEIMEQIRRSKAPYNYAALRDYLYSCSLLKAKHTSAFDDVHRKSLDAIEREWKDYDVYGKATCATLLWRSGRKDAARDILESLTQFALKSPQKGWWFDNQGSRYSSWPPLITTAQALEAFAEIEPGSEAVDGIRQWLVLQKQVEDWGVTPYTAELIWAVMSSGVEWTSSDTVPEVRLGGRKLDVKASATPAGGFTVDLDPHAASGQTLEISKTGGGPAWGGVVSQYVAPIAEVKSRTADGISVSKSLYVIGDNGNATTGPLAVGTKVKVTIVVKTDRDMDYVALCDARAAALRPADYLSGYNATDGLFCYKEIRDNATNFFFSFLPKGSHVISYECFVDRVGEYASGIAEAQCLYAPVIVAHSRGEVVTVR